MRVPLRQFKRPGVGAFSEPQARASDLRIAVDELRKALQLLEATEWPTDADYRRL